MINLMALKPFLDDRAACYECPEFIDSDLVQIPHQFSRKEDIEIAAFLTATIFISTQNILFA